MDNIDIKIKKYIGPNKSLNNFSACFMHVSQKEEVKQIRGDLFTSISLKIGQEHDVNEIVNEILDKLEEQYFNLNTGSVLNALELALNISNDTFLKLIEEKDFDIATFDLSAIVIWGDVIYMGRIGKAGIYLLRQHKVINITESLI